VAHDVVALRAWEGKMARFRPLRDFGSSPFLLLLLTSVKLLDQIAGLEASTWLYCQW